MECREANPTTHPPLISLYGIVVTNIINIEKLKLCKKGLIW